MKVPLVMQPLDTGGVARAQQLEHQMQVRVPGIARQRRAQRDESLNATLNGDADDQCRADVQRSQSRGLRCEIAAWMRSVTNFDNAQMTALAAQVRQALQRLT